MKSTDKYIHIDGIETAFYQKQEKSFAFKGESHGFWEMVYVIDGTVGVAAGSKLYTLNKGDVIFHKPYEFHSIWSTNNTEPTFMVVSFHLSGTGAEHLKGGFFKADKKERLILSEIIKTMKNNYSLAENKNDCSGDTEPEYSLFVYMLDLLLTCFLKHTAKPSDIKSENALIFGKVVNYMEQNLNLNLSNDDFARYANVSTSTLKRIFFSYSSLGVHSYFNNLKIMKAKNLLREGMSVYCVSQSLGFSNQNNFSAAFKKSVGISPSKYR